MLQVCEALLLTVHLLAVNIASGAPFVGIWLAARARRGDGLADTIGRRLARWSLDGLAVGVLLGVALGAILWWLDQEAFFSALAQIEPRRLAFGGLELLVYYGLMAWYLASWGRWQRLGWMHPLIAVVAGTNLVYHFPLLFTVVGLIAERGPAAPASQPFVAWLRDPELLARVAHFCLASVAVTGAAVMLIARAQARDGRVSDADRGAVWGAHLMLWPSLLQLPLGLYVLLQLPERSRDTLLGNDLAATILFGIALLLTLGLMHQLATALLGKLRVEQTPRFVALLGLVVLLMVGARARARQPLLDRWQKTPQPVAAVVAPPPSFLNSPQPLETKRR
ncbi:MAG: hypothetical protein JNG90_11540, partial [Planctomycetaceae bacterium]|nr:hypothetical protein [Planctomycetaceae bacterium]